MVQRNAIYRSKHSGDLFEVVDTPDPFAAGDADNKQVEIERLDDRQWYGVYADNFRSGYEFVAKSEEDLEADLEVA